MIYNENPKLLTLKEKILLDVKNDKPTLEQALKDYQDYNINSAFEYVYNYFYSKIDYMVNTSNVLPHQKDDLFGEVLLRFSIIAKTYVPSNINFNTYFYFCINNTIKGFIIKNQAKKRSLCSTVSMNNLNANTDLQEEYEIADIERNYDFDNCEMGNLLDKTINIHLTVKWRNIINMMIQGYTYTDIGKKYNMSKNVISARICALRKTCSFQRLYRMLKTKNY